MHQNLTTKCPVAFCSHVYADALDVKVHALNHSGRHLNGLPNGRFIHQQTEGNANLTACGLSTSEGKTDEWGNLRTNEGFATTKHEACVTCPTCAADPTWFVATTDQF